MSLSPSNVQAVEPEEVALIEDRRVPYSYNALNIGLVILSFGVGSIIGSILGGRWSDRVLRKMKRANGGVSVPEVRRPSVLWRRPVSDVDCLR